jgi:hypothetical protein
MVSWRGLRLSNRGGEASGGGLLSSGLGSLPKAVSRVCGSVTFREVVCLFPEQLRSGFVPVLHHLQGRL